MFLTHKDLKGTPLHDLKCISRDTRSSSECDCSLRRSAGSVDSLIGQIRAIFKGPWSWKRTERFTRCRKPCRGNNYQTVFECSKIEQSTSAVTPKKATPLFLDKLTIVSRHISYTLFNPRNSLQRNFVLHRDIAFLQFFVYSGDRAWDFGNLRIKYFAFLKTRGYFSR